MSFRGGARNQQRSHFDMPSTSQAEASTYSAVSQKLMKQMGYKGGNEGLGAQGQGRTKPVEAEFRMGRAGLGFGRDSSSKASTVAEKEKTSKREALKKELRIRPRQRAADTVYMEDRPLSAPKMKIVDMTGRETKVYSTYGEFSTREASPRNFDVPQLRHNLSATLHFTQDELHEVYSDKLQAEDLKHQYHEAKSAVEEEREELDRLQEVNKILERLSQAEDGEDSLKEHQDLYRRLQTEFSREFRLHELESAAISAILPPIRSHFALWRPLDDEHRKYGVKLMKGWKKILPAHQTNPNPRFDDSMPAFERLLWECWMPTIRRTVTEWNPRTHSAEMLNVVDVWTPILPSSMKSNFLNQLLIPRITSEVVDWDPLTDEVPAHEWIIPWHENLGDRLAILPLVRQRLARSLRDWEVLDDSALLCLRPWTKVFPKATMTSFLFQHVTPKLSVSLKEMTLHRDLDKPYKQVNVVLDWQGLLGMNQIAELFARSFFPKTVRSWLKEDDTDIKEVKVWFVEWLQRFPQELSEHPVMKEHFRVGMVALAQASQRIPITQLKPRAVSFLSGAQQRPSPSSSPRPSSLQTDGPQSLSLKEVIERTAAAHGVDYIPQTSRHDGKQIYSFGRASIYLDRQIIFLLDKKTKTWTPTTLENLVAHCKY